MPRKLVENAIPVLGVSELERSIEFYRRVLGFEVEWNAGHLCSVSRDGSSIMLRCEEEIAPGTVWIGIDDDSLFDAIGKSGAEVLEPPSNKPWAYEMTIADPDGNVLWLGAEPRGQ